MKCPLLASAVLLAGALAYGQAQISFGSVIGSSAGGRTMYSARGGGYFKSVDDGATWTPFALTEPGSTQPPFAAFAISRQNPSVLFLLTTPAAGMLWKSLDGGETWSRSNTGLPQSGTFNSTNLKIADNNAIYLRLDTSVFKSTDAGANWARVGTAVPGDGRAFDINARNPLQMMYAARAGVWKSVDEGQTWQPSATLRTFEDAGTGAACLATEPQAPDIVHVCVAGPLARVGEALVTGLHRSTNGGSSFLPPVISLQPIGIYLDSNNLYLQSSAGGFCRSSDRGLTIQCIPDSTVGSDLTPTSVRLSHMDLADGNLLFASANRFTFGSFAYRSRDGGRSWQRLGGTGRVTLAKPTAPLSILLAPDSAATLPLSVASLEIPTFAMPFTVTTSGEPWFRVSASSGNAPASLTVTFRSEGLEPGQRYEGSIRVSAGEAAVNELTIPVVLEVARRVTTAGPVYSATAVAGNGNAAFSGDGGLATEAGIGDVVSIAFDRSKNLFLLSGTHNRLRRISAADGKIATVIGTGTSAASPDGTALSQANLNGARGLAIDAMGTIYYSESNGLIRRIQNNLLGTAVPASILSANSLLAMDPQNRLWISNLGRIFRHPPPSGATRLTLNPDTTLVGSSGFAIDGDGNFYVSQGTAGRVWRISPAGMLTLFAGNGASTSGPDGVPAISTGIESPGALAADRAGNVYVVESRRARIRMINREGTIFSIATLEGRTIRDLLVEDDGRTLYAAGLNFISKLNFVEPPPPVLNDVPKNLASSGLALSPGALFFLEGTGLASGDEASGEGPWKQTLAGAGVTFNGMAAALRDATPTRITGQIPYEVPPGETAVRVTTNGKSSADRMVQIAALSPGIFTTPEDPARAASAQVTATEASVLITGFGPLDAEGKAVTGFKAVIGETETEGLRIEAVPGMPGTGRAVFPLPAGTAPGDYTVRIVMGDASSNAALITVPPQA